MNDREVLARMIDEHAFSEEVQARIDRGLPGNWVDRREAAYLTVDRVLEYILARVEEINPLPENVSVIETAGHLICDPCDGRGHVPSTLNETWVVTCRYCGGKGTYEL